MTTIGHSTQRYWRRAASVPPRRWLRVRRSPSATETVSPGRRPPDEAAAGFTACQAALCRLPL